MLVSHERKPDAVKTQATFHKAVKWAYVMNWGEKGFSVLFTFVLASILGPREFGLVAMAMIYIAFIQMFLEQGLVAALIQRKDLTDLHIDSVFWANMLLSVILLSVSIACSSWWARANHVAVLFKFVCVLSLVIPLEGLSIVPRAILLRSMNFRSLSIRSNASVLVGGTVGLVMAFRGWGAWALVGQRVSQDVITAFLLWNLSHWRPRFRASLTCLKELFRFSSANFLSKLSVFGNSYCGALILGIFFGPVSVGIYRLAERLVGMVLDLTTTSLQTVSLPQFSRVQDDLPQLRQSMMSFLRLSSILALPLMVALAVSSTPLMRLLGPKWIPASDVIKLLCLSGMILAFAQFIGPLLQAISKPLYAAVVMWSDGLLSIGLLLTVAKFLQHSATQRQVIGIAATRVAADGLLLIPILLFVLHRFAHIRVREFIRIIYPSAGAGVAIAATVTLLSATGITARMNPLFELICDGVLGGSAGIAVLYMLDRSGFSSAIAPVRTALAKMTARDKPVLETTVE